MNKIKKLVIITLLCAICLFVPQAVAYAADSNIVLSQTYEEIHTLDQINAPYVSVSDGQTPEQTVWTSDNESVVKVDPSTGVVTPVADGVANIKVTMSFAGSEEPQIAEYEVKVDLWNGLHTSADGMPSYYVNGAVDTGFSGIHKVDGQWLYFSNGVNRVDYNGIEKLDSTWWKITTGKVDFNYTGFAKNNYGWWYVRNGKIDFNASGLIQWNGYWWYTKGGKIDFGYAGMVHNAGGWWYVSGGHVDFHYTGLARNQYGWWYYNDGHVDFKATGFAKHDGLWWRVESGRVKFNANGLYKYGGAWWYVKSGMIDMSYNGIAYNGGVWWKVTNGIVDFHYTGLARNQYGWFYLNNGRVNFKATGLCKYNGKWWYVKSGKLDFGYTGLVYFNGKWWHVSGGYVRFDYSGPSENSNGYWYVKNGSVDFSYNGSVSANGLSYAVSHGKITSYVSKLYTVTDPDSDMYGKTLKLYYSPTGEICEDVSAIVGSNHKYELHVNKIENIVTVYTTEGSVYVPVKRFICSNGGSNTPEGTFYTPDKYRWWELMGPCWGQWCTRINGGVLFHSVYYNSYQDNNSLSVRAYNKLGTTCSHGCVRLTAGDAKWIYDNCSTGTKVVVYSKNGYEPFSKPQSYQLPSWHTWDPTDPNMYYKCQQNGCH